MYAQSTFTDNINIYTLDITPCGTDGPIVITNKETGYIQSPNYPSDEINGLKCEWIIKVPKEKSVVVRMMDFDATQRLVIFM